MLSAKAPAHEIVNGDCRIRRCTLVLSYGQCHGRHTSGHALGPAGGREGVLSTLGSRGGSAARASARFVHCLGGCHLKPANDLGSDGFALLLRCVLHSRLVSFSHPALLSSLKYVDDAVEGDDEEQ